MPVGWQRLSALGWAEMLPRNFVLEPLWCQGRKAGLKQHIIPTSHRRLTSNGFSSFQVSGLSGVSAAHRDAGMLGCRDVGMQGCRDAGMQGCRVPRETQPCVPWWSEYFIALKKCIALKDPRRANRLSFLLMGNSIWPKDLLSEVIKRAHYEQN